jgi:biotin-(acetyl-CoA carboxylase) ligase
MENTGRQTLLDRVLTQAALMQSALGSQTFLLALDQEAGRFVPHRFWVLRPSRLFHSLLHSGQLKTQNLPQHALQMGTEICYREESL